MYISPSTVNIMIQPEGSPGDMFDFTFYYTDSFHQNDDWQKISTQIVLFSSTPPIFNTNLNSITVDLWKDYLYTFPTF